VLKISSEASHFSSTDVTLVITLLDAIVKLNTTHIDTARDSNIAKTMSNVLQSPMVALSTAEGDASSKYVFIFCNWLSI